MSKIESASVPYLDTSTLSQKIFPIENYTSEKAGLPLPETYEFLSTRDENTIETLTPVIVTPYFQQNLVKLQRRLHQGYSNTSREGLENALSGFIFEEAAYRYLRNQLNDAILLSPRETARLCTSQGIQDNIQEKVRTIPDGIIFLPTEFTSLIVGTCEYTIRSGLGNNTLHSRRINRDKRKQIMQHITGKVIYDIFSRQPIDNKKKFGNLVNNMYNELPPHIEYDEALCKAILVTPTDNDTPFKHEKCETLRMPITSNDVWHVSMSLLQELDRAPAYYDNPKLAAD